MHKEHSHYKKTIVRYAGLTVADRNRHGFTYPIKVCTKCGKEGSIMTTTGICVACIAIAYNEVKKLTVKEN